MKIDHLLIALVIVITFYSGIVFAKYVLSEEYLKALVCSFFLIFNVWCATSILKTTK